MLEVLTTRFSQSDGTLLNDDTGPSLLVRIYPVHVIEEPVELLSEPVLLGRDTGCTVALPDDSVSRRHALIEPHDEFHRISDLGSTNGTYVNEHRLYEPRILHAGDRVRLGSQVFKYLSSDSIESQYHETVFKLMTTDGLTTVHNKRYFLETLERECEQSRRHASPLCVLMLDLDKFKSVNDTYGHLAGDAVLMEFARRAQAVTRGGDLLARYGGEEFAALLTRTTLTEGLHIAERIRQATSSAPVTFEEFSIPITVSIGVACTTGMVPRDALGLVATADAQLYAAKQAGRNRVCAPVDDLLRSVAVPVLV